MAKQKTKVIKEEPKKWIMTIQNREGFITCPVCNNTENYNIVALPTRCPRCQAILEGMKWYE